MKKVLTVSMLLLFSSIVFSQNKNVQSEVKTTVITVKDSDGEKKIVKNQEINEVQKIEFEDADSKALNKDMKNTPVKVSTETAITIDGVTRLIDVDRSAYYLLNGTKYQIAVDKKGYTMGIVGDRKSGILRKTTNNSYFYINENKAAIGYFDTAGNLILETYDAATDEIIIEKYDIVKE